MTGEMHTYYFLVEGGVRIAFHGLDGEGLLANAVHLAEVTAEDTPGVRVEVRGSAGDLLWRGTG